jgi:NAD(P)-dependent dehydrogenase (short-subunit alcohol dehydrogenase family)
MTEVVVITGASRGIGQAAARRFATDGATVIGTSRTAEGAKSISAAGTGLPGKVHGVRLDLIEAGGDDAFQAAVREVSPHVDVLICNAGIMIGVDTVAEQSVADWGSVLDVNLTGAFRTVRALLPLLEAAATPRLITLHGGLGNISSGMEGGGCVAYRVSKAGVAALTLTVSQESNGILACGYDPGWVRTDLGGDDAPRAPEECGDELAGLAARMAEEKLTGALVQGREMASW